MQELPKSLKPNETYKLPKTPCLGEAMVFEDRFSGLRQKKKSNISPCPDKMHQEYAECVAWITYKIGESAQLTTWKIHSNKMLYCPICKRSLRKYILVKDNTNIDV